MTLRYKPDFEETQKAWRAYWDGELYRNRPLVHAVVPKPRPAGYKEPEHERVYGYTSAIKREYDKIWAAHERWLESTLFLAEAIPFISPEHGPDQFGAFFGGELHYSESSKETTWIEPFVKDKDWKDVLPLKIDKNNSVWKGMLDLSRFLAEKARGKCIVGVTDLHSNGDALSALRGPEQLCMDFYDCPEKIAQAMLDVRAAYPVVYDSIYKACGKEDGTGTIGWLPFYCEGRYAVIQCDFICMVSPEIAREFIIPALDEEANFLDHSVYHLDGPGALPHLDDILSIKKLDAVQWVPGSGQKPMHQWTDVLQKCQKAGKGLIIHDVTPDDVKGLHRKVLRPERVLYQVSASTEKEVMDLLSWLEKN